MPRDRPSLIGIVLGTWRRLLPSPGQVLRSTLSPRRFFRRFRLRYVALLAAACVVWVVAMFTEPAPAASGFGAPARTQSAVAGQESSTSPAPVAIERTVATSPEAAARFFRKVASAVEAGVRTGRVHLSITETEATSAMDAVAQLVEIREVMSTLSPEELEQLDTPEEIRRVMDARNEEPPDDLLGRVRYAMKPRLRFREVQVRFRPDGRVVVSGYAHAWNRRAPVYMDAVPALEDGQLDLDFRETRLGRLRVPNWVLGAPADLLALVLGLGSDYARLDALGVRDGRLTVSGRVRLPMSENARDDPPPVSSLYHVNGLVPGTREGEFDLTLTNGRHLHATQATGDHPGQSRARRIGRGVDLRQRPRRRCARLVALALAHGQHDRDVGRRAV